MTASGHKRHIVWCNVNRRGASDSLSMFGWRPALMPAATWTLRPHTTMGMVILDEALEIANVDDVGYT